MTQATANQLLHIFGAGKITAFFLVLARVSPLFILAPMFSSKMLPAKVRGIVAVAISVGLVGVATHGQHISTDPLQVAALIAKELIVGAAFAMAVAAVFAAVQVAGAFTDAITGFSFGGMVDPVDGNQGGVVTQVYEIVGVMIFVAIGGDAWMLRGLGRTFDLVPLTKMPKINLMVTGVAAEFSSIFTAALEIAAPAMLALLITDVAFGVVSRVVPQLNVFAVGFPVKIGVGLLVIIATMPFIGGWMTNQLTTSVSIALHTLRIA